MLILTKGFTSKHKFPAVETMSYRLIVDDICVCMKFSMFQLFISNKWDVWQVPSVVKRMLLWNASNVSDLCATHSCCLPCQYLSSLDPQCFENSPLRIYLHDFKVLCVLFAYGKGVKVWVSLLVIALLHCAGVICNFDCTIRRNTRINYVIFLLYLVFLVCLRNAKILRKTNISSPKMCLLK